MTRVRWVAHLVLAASACAGAPVEAGPTFEDTTGTPEFPTTMSSTTNATTLETLHPWRVRFAATR